MSYPHLYFDSSNSAVIRFCGPVVEVGMHWVDGAVLSQTKMICPDSIKPDDEGWESVKKHKNKKCLLCEQKISTSDRWLSVGWDVGQKMFCVYMAHAAVFKEVFDQCKAQGITPQMIGAGDGGDFVLQRLGGKTSPLIMANTIGTKRFDARPPLGEVLEHLRKNSVWTKYSDKSVVLAAYKKVAPAPTKTVEDDDDESYPSSVAMKTIAVPSKHYSKPPEPEFKKPSKKKVDPKKLLGGDRWDFV